jgi:hypothetical protein
MKEKPAAAINAASAGARFDIVFILVNPCGLQLEAAASTEVNPKKPGRKIKQYHFIFSVPPQANCCPRRMRLKIAQRRAVTP